MRKIFEVVGAIVTVLLGLIVAIPVLLTVIGVAVPAILIFVAIVLLIVLLVLAICGVVALLTFWRIRYQLKRGGGVDFVFNGKRYHVETIAKRTPNNRRDVTDDI